MRLSATYGPSARTPQLLVRVPLDTCSSAWGPGGLLAILHDVLLLVCTGSGVSADGTNSATRRWLSKPRPGSEEGCWPITSQIPPALRGVANGAFGMLDLSFRIENASSASGERRRVSGDEGRAGPSVASMFDSVITVVLPGAPLGARLPPRDRPRVTFIGLRPHFLQPAMVGRASAIVQAAIKPGRRIGRFGTGVALHRRAPLLGRQGSLLVSVHPDCLLTLRVAAYPSTPFVFVAGAIHRVSEVLPTAGATIRRVFLSRSPVVTAIGLSRSSWAWVNPGRVYPSVFGSCSSSVNSSSGRPCALPALGLATASSSGASGIGAPSAPRSRTVSHPARRRLSRAPTSRGRAHARSPAMCTMSSAHSPHGRHRAGPTATPLRDVPQRDEQAAEAFATIAQDSAGCPRRRPRAPHRSAAHAGGRPPARVG